MKKPVKDFVKKLQTLQDEFRDLRESKANPCNEEFAEGVCPCHAFDGAIDHLQMAENKLKEIRK